MFAQLCVTPQRPEHSGLGTCYKLNVSPESFTVLLFSQEMSWSLTTCVDNNWSRNGLSEFSLFIYKSKQVILP